VKIKPKRVPEEYIFAYCIKGEKYHLQRGGGGMVFGPKCRFKHLVLIARHVLEQKSAWKFFL
jgi:hypothetical protein